MIQTYSHIRCDVEGCKEELVIGQEQSSAGGMRKMVKELYTDHGWGHCWQVVEKDEVLKKLERHMCPTHLKLYQELPKRVKYARSYKKK